MPRSLLLVVVRWERGRCRFFGPFVLSRIARAPRGTPRFSSEHFKRVTQPNTTGLTLTCISSTKSQPST
jgi:hypothetical protein